MSFFVFSPTHSIRVLYTEVQAHLTWEKTTLQYLALIENEELHDDGPLRQLHVWAPFQAGTDWALEQYDLRRYWRERTDVFGKRKTHKVTSRTGRTYKAPVATGLRLNPLDFAEVEWALLRPMGFTVFRVDFDPLGFGDRAWISWEYDAFQDDDPDMVGRDFLLLSPFEVHDEFKQSLHATHRAVERATVVPMTRGKKRPRLTADQYTKSIEVLENIYYKTGLLLYSQESGVSVIDWEARIRPGTFDGPLITGVSEPAFPDVRRVTGKTDDLFYLPNPIPQRVRFFSARLRWSCLSPILGT